jgi:hypothetical protein
MLLLERINKSGKCFIDSCRLDGRIALRFSCGGEEQKLDDMRTAWDVITHEAMCVIDADGS